MWFATYEYKLFPTKEQKQKLYQMLNQQDEVYNNMAAFAAAQYNAGQQVGEIKAQIWKSNWAAWLSQKALEKIKKRICGQIDRLAYGEICNIGKRTPYQKRRTIEFPQVNLYGQYVEVPWVGWIAVNMYRPLPMDAKIYSVVITEYLYGAEYKVSFHLIYETAAPATCWIRNNKVLGLDYKQDGLFVDSNGNNGEYPGFLRQGNEKVNELYRTAARFKVGSSRWLKFMRRAEKCKMHMRNQRRDWQFKQAARLANENDAICVETLDFREMCDQNTTLAPKVYDNNWPGFKAKLERRLNQQGKPLVEVSRYYPSSQICHRCGYRFGKVPLSQRYIQCPACGCGMDRDVNAACNIRNEGIRMLTAA